MRMYVWHPRSLGDYTDGAVCVIAESKRAAVELAIDERFPLASCKRGMSTRERAAVVRANLDSLSQRCAFRDELLRDKPRVVRRGAVITFGGS